MFHSVSRRLS